MAIIVILSGVAVMSLDSIRGPYDLAAAVDSIQTAWATARAHAVDEGQKYRFAVVWGTGNYRIAPDSADYWSGGGAQAGSGYVAEESLPKGIPFDQSDDSTSAGSNGGGSWSTVVTFLPDGTALQDAKVVLSGKGLRPKIVTIRGITGVVRVMDSSKDHLP